MTPQERANYLAIAIGLSPDDEAEVVATITLAENEILERAAEAVANATYGPGSQIAVNAIRFFKHDEAAA